MKQRAIFLAVAVPALGLACALFGTALLDACGRSPIAELSYDAGPPNTCTLSQECAWGEIDHEILQSSECPCLFGCPYLPQSSSTVARRRSQYSNLCTPGKDGSGRACPIDDCAIPGSLVCKAGACAAALPDMK